MAQLVSIRSPPSISAKHGSLNTDLSIANPAFSGDVDIKLNEAEENHIKSNGTDRLEGTTISFHNITYTVDTKVNRKKTQNDIVKGIRYMFEYVNM